MMERAAVLSQGDTISPTLLPDEVFNPVSARIAVADSADPAPESLVMEPHVVQLEKRLIEEALRRTGDNKSAAARLLEISERSLWYKIKKYGV
jgi:two-component system response regulator AtoC